MLNTVKEKSIGLPATRERIRIFFGEKSSVTVLSEPGQGTKVIIEIPLEEEGDFEN